jgi:cytochrome c oxidase cbb3-type subunit 3
MRTERIHLPRVLAALLVCGTLPLMAQDTGRTMAETRPEIPMTVIYGLVGAAVVQAIFILSLSSIMRTLGGPGAWAKRLGQGGKRALMLLPLIAFGALDASAQAYKGEGSTIPVYHLFWWLVGTNVFLLMVLLVQISLLRSLTRAVTGVEEKPMDVAVPTGPSWEQRLVARLTRQKPIAEEQDILLHHEYDGIRELDNVLPPWWLWLFYGSIAWGVVYLVNVHMIGVWPLQQKEYAAEMAQAQVDIDAYLAAQKSSVDERSVVLLTDVGALAQGAGIFKQNCATCHGQLGEGTAGPNLTDPYWLHGGGITEVFTTVKYGVSGKAMKSWKTDLKPLEIQAVASYVLSLQGSLPPNPKVPEGELWKGSKNVPSDSLSTPTDSLRLPADTARLAQR